MRKIRNILTLFLVVFCWQPLGYSKANQLWTQALPSSENAGISKSAVVNRLRDGVLSIEVSVVMKSVYKPFKLPEENAITGSGFFINDEGYILSNAHVIGGVRSVKTDIYMIRPTKIFISTQKAAYEKFEAELIGIFEKGDLALLKLVERDKFLEYHDNKITYLPLSDSDSLKVGEDILALGYPLNKKNLTVTEGIISGFTKSVRAAYQHIQTNSAINKGNSGGPSLDKHGSVIGINGSIERKAQNMNYIIPINMVKAVLPRLLKDGKVSFPSLDAWWEFNSEDTARYLKGPENKGVVLQYIIPGGTADRAGMQKLDILTKIGDIDIDYFGIGSKLDQDGLKKIIEPFESYKNRYAVGSAIPIQYYRDGEKFEKTITLYEEVELPIGILELDDEPDYEIWGGMVIQQLNMNIVRRSDLPEIHDITDRYAPMLTITHVFRDSEAYKSRLIHGKQILYKMNGKKVETLKDVRQILDNLGKEEFLVLELSSRVFVALDVKTVLEDEPLLKKRYGYVANRPN